MHLPDTAFFFIFIFFSFFFCLCLYVGYKVFWQIWHSNHFFIYNYQHQDSISEQYFHLSIYFILFYFILFYFILLSVKIRNLNRCHLFKSPSQPISILQNSSHFLVHYFIVYWIVCYVVLGNSICILISQNHRIKNCRGFLSPFLKNGSDVFLSPVTGNFTCQP